MSRHVMQLAGVYGYAIGRSQKIVWVVISEVVAYRGWEQITRSLYKTYRMDGFGLFAASYASKHIYGRSKAKLSLGYSVQGSMTQCMIKFMRSRRANNQKASYARLVMETAPPLPNVSIAPPVWHPLVHNGEAVWCRRRGAKKFQTLKAYIMQVRAARLRQRKWRFIKQQCKPKEAANEGELCPQAMQGQGFIPWEGFSHNIRSIIPPDGSILNGC